MISIILRAKNEMPWVKYTLRMLKRQRCQDFELLCVDSGSTDGTWEVLQEFKPDIIYQIKPEEYIPGKVLNEAIAKTQGNIIVFNNADCIPQNEFWLENLVSHITPINLRETDVRLAQINAETNSISDMLNKQEIVAAFANQLPRPNAIPLVIKDYERAFGDGSIHKTWRHFFSLASSAVRRDIITQYPFKPDIQYSEDIEWSWRIKKLGMHIAYAENALVEHSHNYNIKQIIKRYTGEGRAERVIYAEEYASEKEQGYIKDFNFLRNVILTFGMETLRDWIWLSKKGDLEWMLKSPVYRFFQRYSAFKGRIESK